MFIAALFWSWILFVPQLPTERQWIKPAGEEIQMIMASSHEARKRLGASPSPLLDLPTGTQDELAVRLIRDVGSEKYKNLIDSIEFDNRDLPRQLCRDHAWLFECLQVCFPDGPQFQHPIEVVWDSMLPSEMRSVRVHNRIYLSKDLEKAEQVGWIGWEVGLWSAMQKWEASLQPRESPHVDGVLAKSPASQPFIALREELSAWVVSGSLGRQAMGIAHRHCHEAGLCPIPFQYVTRLWEEVYYPDDLLRSYAEATVETPHSALFHHPMVTSNLMIGRALGYLFARVGRGNFGANRYVCGYPSDSTDALVLKFVDKDLATVVASRELRQSPLPNYQELGIELARVLGYRYGFLMPDPSSPGHTILYAVFPASGFLQEWGKEAPSELEDLQRLSLKHDSAPKAFSHPLFVLNADYVILSPHIAYVFLDLDREQQYREKLVLIRPYTAEGEPPPTGKRGAYWK